MLLTCGELDQLMWTTFRHLTRQLTLAVGGGDEYIASRSHRPLTKGIYLSCPYAALH